MAAGEQLVSCTSVCTHVDWLVDTRLAHLSVRGWRQDAHLLALCTQLRDEHLRREALVLWYVVVVSRAQWHLPVMAACELENRSPFTVTSGRA